jgi:acyl carrier protein
MVATPGYSPSGVAHTDVWRQALGGCMAGSARPSQVQTDLVVRATVARQLSLPPDDVTGDLDLRAGLGAAEEEFTALLAAMGEALDARFPDDFFDGVHTFGQLAAAVRVSLSPL